MSSVYVSRLASGIFPLNSNRRLQAAALSLNEKIDRETKLDSGGKFGLLGVFSREFENSRTSYVQIVINYPLRYNSPKLNGMFA